MLCSFKNVCLLEVRDKTHYITSSNEFSSLQDRNSVIEMIRQVRITSTLSLISIVSLLVSINGNSINILGPTCRGIDDEGARSINCGSSIQTNVEGGTKILGDLCSDEKRLQISILREDIDVQRN